MLNFSPVLRVLVLASFLSGLLFPVNLFSQDCNCLSELEFVRKTLQKTPSYKEQVKGQAKKEFEVKVRNIKTQIEADPLIDKHCLVYLARLTKLVKDEHIFIFPPKVEIPDSNDTEKIKAFLQSEDFKSTPVSNMDVEAIAESLLIQPASDIEGLYYSADKEYKIAVIRKPDSSYEGITIEAGSRFWEPGQIKFQTLSGSSDFVEAVIYDALHRARYYREKSVPRLLENWGFYKDPSKKPAFRPSTDRSVPEFKELSDSVVYLSLPSFSGSTENLRILDPFYPEIKGQLSKYAHLLIDVRDNGGGGRRAYNALLDIFEELKDKLQFHVLINRNTASAAEHFAIDVIGKGGKLHGENSKGAIYYQYGNRGKRKNSYSTPCYDYQMIVTVASNPKKYRTGFQEVSGLEPEFKLDPDKDWISQVLLQFR